MNKRRFLAILMSLLMVLQGMPLNALADVVPQTQSSEPLKAANATHAVNFIVEDEA